MKNYVSPVVLENDVLAEGIFAAGSGETPYEGYGHDGECWTINVYPDNRIAHEGYATFRMHAEHINAVHISKSTKVVITFNQPITSAVAESSDWKVDVVGPQVIVTRECHGNAYTSKDVYNSMFKVYCADAATVNVVGEPGIFCEYTVNVQGDTDRH